MKCKALLIISVTLCLASTCSEDLTRLSVLEGTWRMKTKTGYIFEVWKHVDQTELESRSFKVSGADTILLEQVRLVHNRDGIFYIPKVEGQNNNEPVSFKLVERTNNSFTFENKEHDYPNRITYTFVNADSIVARIEGDKGGALKGSNYYFAKVQ